MGLPIFRLAQLQLVQGEYNRQRAEHNRIRLFPVASNRGQLLDRNGKILAANRVSRSVYLWPKEQAAKEWPATASLLSSILKIPKEEILKKLEKVGYKSALPIRIRQDISRATFISLSEQAGNLQGIEIRPESSRDYPYGDLAAHVLGYIGEASLDQLKANPKYPMGMIVGQLGVERIANSSLEGVWGNRLIEVNAKGQEIQELGVNSPVAGKSVQLTLDL